MCKAHKMNPSWSYFTPSILSTKEITMLSVPLINKYSSTCHYKNQIKEKKLQ